MKAPKRGFVLVEALAVLFILLSAASAAYFALSSFRDRQILNSGAEAALAVLYDARVRTLAARSNNQFGINFQSDRLILFQGPSYPGVTFEEILLDRRLTISEIALNGGPSAIFQRLNGVTDNAGTVTINLKSDPAQRVVIRVYSTGLVAIE